MARADEDELTPAMVELDIELSSLRGRLQQALQRQAARRTAQGEKSSTAPSNAS